MQTDWLQEVLIIPCLLLLLPSYFLWDWPITYIDWQQDLTNRKCKLIDCRRCWSSPACCCSSPSSGCSWSAERQGKKIKFFTLHTSQPSQEKSETLMIFKIPLVWYFLRVHIKNPNISHFYTIRFSKVWARFWWICL